ncbi:hypothetical protein H2199_000918 [Coniosporium tulheliwenetii]|uniref:Uncharacterized protein n=1 Tax=Coniosporium tulheliwenetii TaxID=3383036 RepID=A0ACC2ZN20_9PEZI|nr:hypothetical protein H2199_000918 [Cladosporium sp. JES 115]
MTTTVEARSLSSITALAANPPQYPRNPTQQKHDPLVLYIARVPGSKDVFLTPLKPREKVVSAEDVHSCLYYLHVDQPEDAILGASESSVMQEGGSQAEELAQPAIQRKPLPQPPLEEALPPAPTTSLRRHARQPSPTKQAQRDPAPPAGLSVRNGVENQFNINASSLSRKPVASRPANHFRGKSDGMSTRGQENIHPDLSGRRQSEQLPRQYSMPMRDLRLSDSSARHSEDTLREKTFHPSSLYAPYEGFGEPSQYKNSEPDSPRRLDRTAAPPSGVSLTLIRRDPTSGAQWNVAKIRDPQVDEVSSNALLNPATAQRSRPSGSPMYIQIDTPGYSKFLYDDETRPKLQSRDSERSFAWSEAFNGSWTSMDRDLGAARDPAFRRRLWMEGTRYSGSFGHRKVSSNGSISGSEMVNSSMDLRRSSGENSPRSSEFGHFPLQRESQPGTGTLTIDSPRSSFRGYVFLSPWNGRCEFSTAAAGKSLKCKHTIPTNSSALAPSDSVTISELRFNLPVPTVRSSPATPSENGSSTTKRSSVFSRPRLRSQYSSSSVSLPTQPDGRDMAADMARLDLSLGQEIAGGGFGGKQAKLGKLIVEDEGLRMLDLVVAANLALWWRAWERVCES